MQSRFHSKQTKKQTNATLKNVSLDPSVYVLRACARGNSSAVIIRYENIPGNLRHGPNDTTYHPDL